LQNARNLKHKENICWDNELTDPLTGLLFFFFFFLFFFQKPFTISNQTIHNENQTAKEVMH